MKSDFKIQVFPEFKHQPLEPHGNYLGYQVSPALKIIFYLFWYKVTIIEYPVKNFNFCYTVYYGILKTASFIDMGFVSNLLFLWNMK